MMKMLKPALGLFLVLTLITGVAYPLVVTGIAQVVMPGRASGSLIERDGRAVGSALIGQSYADAGHFWSRPSATGPQPYNGAASTGSNLSPTNPALIEAIHARVQALRAADPGNTAPVPVDLVTASGSGLDPHITPAAALYQISRVARARGMAEARLRALVEAHVEGRTLGLLGEPRVNVLKLNLALDAGSG
jgi:potassium-transporting ATPase KdpC subunit